MTIDLSKLRTVHRDYDKGALDDVVDVPVITGDAIAHYERYARGKPAIAFCVSVRHAENVARTLRGEGWRSVCAHGGMRKEERDAAIAGLATGEVQVLTCCDLISEGLDVPAVGAVILLRPTQSLGLFVQQIGRGLRPTYAPGYNMETREGRLAAIAASDKPALIVLDHVGNTIRHGLPDTPREWSLDSRKRKERKEEAPETSRCPHCFAVQRPARTCDACGFIFPVEDSAQARKEIQQVAGDLQEMSADRMQQLRDAALSGLLRPGMSFGEIDEIRLARGYKRGWTYYKFKELGSHRGGASA